MPNYISEIKNLIHDAGLDWIRPAVDPVLLQPEFATWPASTPWKNGEPKHHGDEGGLARHTYQVMKIARGNAKLHLIDSVPIIIAAIWHDMGKLQCYIKSPENGWVKTPTHPHHHITLGLAAWGAQGPALCAKIGEPGYYSRVLHMIASHHGRKEWGSGEVPTTLEAVILHHADLQSVLMENGANPYVR